MGCHHHSFFQTTDNKGDFRLRDDRSHSPFRHLPVSLFLHHVILVFFRPSISSGIGPASAP